MAKQQQPKKFDDTAIIARSKYWVDLAKEVWQPCRDLFEEGWSVAMKRRHLLQRPAEPDEAYSRRVESAYLDNHFGVAVRGYAALLGKWEYDDAPLTLTETDRNKEESQIASDVDFNGNSFRVFLNNMNQTALTLGTCLAIVDYEGKSERPYLRRWDIDQVYGFRTLVEGGRTYASSFACKYESTETNDKGELETVCYYLQYQHRPARTQLWKQGEKGMEKIEGENIIKGANGKALEEIPVVWHDFSGNAIGDPPLPLLFSLARLNITHFNSLSEFQTILTVVNGPTPLRFWAPGSPPPEERPDMYLGINSVLDMPAGSDVRFLEPSGNALGISYEVIQGQVEGMQRLGQRFLSGGEVARTATEAMLDSAQAESLLLDLAARVENTAEEIFKLWRVFTDANYTYPEKAGSIRVNTDALLLPMQPQESAAIESKFMNGLIDGETAIKMLMRGGWLKEEDLSAQMKTILKKGKLSPPEKAAKDTGKKDTKEAEPEEPEDDDDDDEMEEEGED